MIGHNHCASYDGHSWYHGYVIYKMIYVIKMARIAAEFSCHEELKFPKKIYQDSS